MKKTLFFLLLCSFLACQPTEQTTTQKINYPTVLQKVFDHHGGIDQWQKMRSLSYEIVREKGNEKQMINLQDRRERIEGINFTTGFDGKDIWVEADTSYKGNPRFYYQLMFYFYAMPFVVGDEGIVYSETEPIEYDGKTYLGISIAYEAGVGLSPKDEYFIYYDPSTYEMAWLGYTVTYFSNEKSKKIRYIHYNDWATFNGIKLPSSMTWHKVEEGKIMEPRNTVQFAKVQLSTTPLGNKTFERTPNAIVAE